MKGKLAYLVEPRKVEIREEEVPGDIEPGAILAQVLRANVCGSELHLWKGHHPQIKKGILGHEMVGRALRIGQGVETDFAGQPLREGDRVAATYFLTCRRCRTCQTGDFNLCENAYKYWTKPPEEWPHFHGAFATHYYIHPDQYVYKVPDQVPDYAAAGANCALSQVLFGLEQAKVKRGERVVLQGAGGLGLYAIAVAREMGAQVIVIEGVPSRLEKARRFGAHHVLDLTQYPTPEARAEAVRGLTGGLGADVGMELTGVPAAFAEGILLVRPGGRYVSIGNISPGFKTEFDPGLMTRRNLRILALVRYYPWYLKKALDFLAATLERYPYQEVVDAEFGLDDVQVALEKADRREVTRPSLLP